MQLVLPLGFPIAEPMKFANTHPTEIDVTEADFVDADVADADAGGDGLDGLGDRETIDKISAPGGTAATATIEPADLAQLLAWVEVNIANPRKLREMTSALYSLARWRGAELADLPTDPAAMRQLFNELHHVRLGVSKMRLGNAKSLVRGALELAGTKATNRPVAEIMTPAWQAIWVSVSKRHWRRDAQGARGGWQNICAGWTSWCSTSSAICRSHNPVANCCST
jgi:hypothetical protein